MRNSTVTVFSAHDAKGAGPTSEAAKTVASAVRPSFTAGTMLLKPMN